MTRQNSLKRLVRARMADTGQSYTTARRIVLSQLSGERFGGVVADGYLRPRSQADRGAGRAAHGRPRPYPQAAQPAAQPRQRRAGRPTFSARSRPACAPTAASTAWRAATTPSARPGGTWPLRALPGGVPLLAETRALLDRRDAAFAAEGAGATDELRGIWARLDVLAEQADAGFPLAAAVDELLRGLQARLVAIYQDEVAARDELRAILA
jgi:hypothetical protein